MKRKLLLGFAVLALVVASAKSYSITLFQASVVAGHELKAGDYTVEVDGAKAIIRGRKESVEDGMKVEENTHKFGATTVRYDLDGGKYRIQSIHLGGTKTTLVFE